MLYINFFASFSYADEMDLNRIFNFAKNYDAKYKTAEVDKMMNQYNIEGYPTIKLLKDGQVIEYDAKPSKDTLNQFLNTVL